jgi:hypothetical protein
MMKKFFISCLFAIHLGITLNAQCTVNNINGDLIISSNIIMTGTYNVTGKFVVPNGINVVVQSYTSNTCGKLVINADKIYVYGNILADNAGYQGGLGGAGGTSVTSTTGDVASLAGCNNKDNSGNISVEGGKGGSVGNGPGGGNGGNNGTNGSGPKQQCQSNDDECGMIGSGGGGGAGAGGSYGGKGGNGSNGGNGTNSNTVTGVNVSPAFAVVPGIGGTGGVSTSTLGTISGNDIDLGSGGGGSGGGGRSLVAGLQGNKGGDGGGMIILSATDSLVVTGNISSNGSNGQSGGKGGDGGVSPKCCSDGCNDCGEATLSCGSGGGSGAGGGAGGGIFLQSQNKAVITGTLQSKGGNGGNGGLKGNGTSCNYSATFCGTQDIISGNGFDGTAGGGGGCGRIKISVPLCSGNTITPTYSVNAGNGANNGTSGSYHVICGNVSLFEQYVYHELSIIPNPAKDYIEIKFKHIGNKSINGVISICDINGKEVLYKDFSSEEAEAINVSELSNGVYFLKFINKEWSLTQKFIKQ